MSKEYYPVNCVETYYQDPTYDHLKDNNRVPISGAFFHSYVPIESMNEINRVGLPNAERTIFTETNEKPLPQALKDGEMCLSDIWSVIAPGPDFQG